MADKKEADPTITDEKILTISLRKEWTPSTRVTKTKKSVSGLKKYVIKHTKAKGIKVSPKLNTLMWKGGAKRPVTNVKVKVTLDSEGIASIKLPEEITLEEEKKRFLGKGKDKNKAIEKPAEEKKTEEKTEKEAEKRPEE